MKDNILPSPINFRNNVTFNVYDEVTHKLISSTTGHNRATNSMLIGIAHYLLGDGVKNQGVETLRAWLPQYISLGTMGLRSQECDEDGLPLYLGSIDTDDDYLACKDYMTKIPGFGADGYDGNQNNGRAYFGLGPTFENRPNPDKTIDCELIKESIARTEISFRELVTETNAELPRTVDVVLSAMVSTGALARFREPDKDYIFITEAGLWCKPTWRTGGDNGLLAGYRIAPSDEDNWDMSDPDNRRILRQSILRVGYNQVLQIIWKIQLGSLPEFSAVTISRDKWIDYRNISWLDGTNPSPVPIPHPDDSSDEPTEGNSIYFSFTDVTTDVTTGKVTIRGKQATISGSGTYVLKGHGRGSVKVTCTGVTLVLENLAIVSDDSNPIEFTEGTNTIWVSGENTLSNEYSTSDYTASIHAKGDKLTISGDGSLNIRSVSRGIDVDRTLLLGSGSYGPEIHINADDEGIQGTTVRARAGVITIDSLYNGIQVTNDLDTTTTPAFYISGGTVTIHSSRYGIYANEGNVHISEGLLQVYGGEDATYTSIAFEDGCYWTGGQVFAVSQMGVDQTYTAGKYVEFKNLELDINDTIEIHNELNHLVYSATLDRFASRILYSESEMFGYYRLYVDGEEIAIEKTVTKTIIPDDSSD